MKTIKEILKVPSAALQAMVDGLRKQSKRKNFRIDMGSFGEVAITKSLCFGCAATCAAQQIAGKNLTPTNVGTLSKRAKKLNFDVLDLSKFEQAMDHARRGLIGSLFDYFCVAEEHSILFDNRFYLWSDSWEEQLPKVEALIEELKSKGL